MAAYFLPSYFQKRLLRYALSRLDFIDSDALDLDNLAFTIGQRSAIELKNVGIKVSKVVERIDIPSNVRPRHASIRTLRVTIPADLHVSGIQVEVDGIDVEVDIDQNTAQEEKSKPSSRGSRAPSHKDTANRPRIASTASRGPGNLYTSKRHYDIASSHILPAPEDLAASFLEAEPEQEKQELQAAVESKSIYLQQSSSGLEASTSEDGMGMPEGFSLPGFVTNFFTGIADRLSVSIRHVAVRLSLRADNDPALTEPIEFILKVEELELQSLNFTSMPDNRADPRRCIRIMGVELLVVSDSDLFSQKSATSSPKLLRSRSTASNFSRREDDQQARSLQNLNSSSNSLTASSDHGPLGFGIHESMLETSQLFDPSLSHSGYASSSESPKLERLSPIDSRDQTVPSSSGSQHVGIDQSADDELAESKVFSHDEAESMYMSAISNASDTERMPGSFDQISDKTSDEMAEETFEETISPTSLHGTQSSKPSIASTPTIEKVEQEIHESQLLGAQVTSEIQPSHAKAPQQCTKRILRINEATFKMPNPTPKGRDADDMNTSVVKARPGSAGRDRIPPNTQYSSQVSHARMSSTQSVYGIPKEQSVKVDEAQSFEVLLGDVEFVVDISICHLILKSATYLSSSVKQAERPTAVPKQRASDMQFLGSIKSVILNVMESVPETSAATEQHMPTESTFSVRGDDAPLLQLQVLKIQTQLAINDGKLDQKLSIHRIGLYREADNIISFFDPAGLQESFVTSSVMLEPDDVVIRQLDNRMDIAVKPMHVRLDLLVVDDILSRSGGLSSLLDLGSSVASASTTRDVKPTTNTAPPRRRSVHFDNPSSRPRSNSDDEGGLKLNLRISATIVDLVGSQSTLQIKSSSIKLVYRPSKLRASISSASLRGPIMRDSPSKDVLNLRLRDIQFIYLETPEEEDLDRLLQLLVPSNDKYEHDDDIMVDTLLRQRRKGGVVRLSVQEVQCSASGLAWTQRLGKLGEEIAKLSTVTKYLPEDDRPGILTFALVKKMTVQLDLDKQFGPLLLRTSLLEGAQISVPSLMAAQISSISLTRGQAETLIRELIPDMQESTVMGPPMLMCRFIPDEMEPTVKLKLSNTCLEYSVPLLLAVTQLVESLQADLASELKPLSPRASEISSVSSEASDLARKIQLSLSLRSSALSLRPLGAPACALFLFTDTVVNHSSRHSTISASMEIHKASILLIDDVARIGNEGNGPDSKFYFDQTDHVQELVKSGFVPIGSISAAAANLKIVEDKLSKKQFVDVELRNNLLFLETCADSTQTLIQVLSGLSPPAPPSKAEKYRTEVVPLEDMLASWSGNAYVAEQGPDLGLQVEEGDNTPTPSTILAPGAQQELSQVLSDKDDDDEDEHFMNALYASQAEDAEADRMTESTDLSQSAHSSMGGGSVHIAPVNITADDQPPITSSVMMHSLIDFRDNHFAQKSSIGGTAHRWDSTQNTYGMGSETNIEQSPLKVRVRDVHIIWNLFDGYDWQNTRDVITQGVRDVEERAFAKQRRRESHRSPGPDEEDESVIGDVLFNSIYISIPTNRDPRELTNAINMELGDAASETGSYATSTTVTAATSKRNSGPRYRPKKLKLSRSRSHKITFELEGLAADFFAFPSGLSEVESSVDVRVRKLEIFDHVPTSTWKKFATYMHEAGEREVGTDMVHIELLNVKPIADLAASEMVLKLTVLPLRLHVDQDALDFMTRFFEFKDDRAPPSTAPSNPPFIQRAEVNPIRLRLDFKPKRVDYAGLKSGKLTEFMNFIILERSDMVLRRVILYGVSGFDRLGIMLNNIWTPDVRNNQLPGVLAGLAPVRSLVDVGSGVRDLIAVPIREYKKDGRIVRSIQKGALAFAKTTTTELVNLGAKLAIGTQTVLQNAEGVLAPHTKQQSTYTADSDDEDHQKQISLYADQPLGIIQGLRGAYSSLERDLLLAKDAIVAVPGEIMADGSATGAAKVMLKQSPTIILRPAIGVTKAMGQAFLGAGNTLDKGNRRRIEDKYKKY